MKIESIIRRAGGTKVGFSEEARWPAGEYHFKPESDATNAPHVCDVTVEEHVNRFLSLSDAYRPAASEIGAKIVQPKPAAPSKPLLETEHVAVVETDAGIATITDIPGGADALAALRETTVRALKGTINTYPKELLQAALAAEKASGDPRKSWIEVVEAHLGA